MGIDDASRLYWGYSFFERYESSCLTDLGLLRPQNILAYFTLNVVEKP